jgi:hypothetical protein
MGMAMASRQNVLYTIFFSQLYLTTTLVYLGLGRSAAVALTIKSIITTLAHSSIPWDKPYAGSRWPRVVVCYAIAVRQGCSVEADKGTRLRKEILSPTTRFGLRSGVTGIRRRATSTTSPRAWVSARPFVSSAKLLLS